MISFRFHLVSLIAVFLALGLGILVGSTVVDQVIVDRLDREIKDVRHDSSQANEENRLLKDQIAQNEDFLKKSAPYAVDQRLAGEPVVVIADKGVDGGTLKSMLAMLKDAGAEVPGVLWLSDSWRLDKPTDLTSLHAAAAVSGNNASARMAALRLVARRVSEPPTNAERQSDVLESLLANGFLTLSDGKKDDLASFPSASARVLVVTGTDSDLEGTDTLTDLVKSLVNTGTPVVVAEAYDDHHLAPPTPQRGASVTPIRGDKTLSKAVSTLDDAELVQGQVTAVIALEGVGNHVVGHYGYGQGASTPLPPLGP